MRIDELESTMNKHRQEVILTKCLRFTKVSNSYQLIIYRGQKKNQKRKEKFEQISESNTDWISRSFRIMPRDFRTPDLTKRKFTSLEGNCGT